MRIFVVDAEQVARDDEIVDGTEASETWWDLMVRQHAKLGFTVGRVSLTGALLREMPALQDTVSMFMRPGEGQWAVAARAGPAEDALVRVSFIGAPGCRRYRSLLHGLSSFSREWTLNSEGHACVGSGKVLGAIEKWI